MNTQILVPLDGSPWSEQALGCAVTLEGDAETAIAESRAYLDRVAARLKGQGVRVSTVLQIGAVADSIIDYGEAGHADLIAMCTHGRTGIGRWLLGSVADRVLRAGSTPILLVRAG